MTFSIIVPVYNVEKYLADCLDSILNQTYDSFEVIVVNDGSPDNSQAIIDEYAKKYPEKISAFVKENGGLSDARNFGIKKACGDYLLFVDSDDYISPELLSKLNEIIIKDKSDVIRFSAQVVFENGDTGETFKAPIMNGVTGECAISTLIDNKQMFEPACFYAYKRQFWQQNNFAFEVGRFHEDFGLIPEVIMKADRFSSTEHIGYYYVQTSTSITRGNTDKAAKGANDVLYLVTKLRSITQACNFKKETSDKILSYLGNAAIYVVNNLSGDSKTEYLNRLKEEKIFDLLLSNSLIRKAKRFYVKLKYGALR